MARWWYGNLVDSSSDQANSSHENKYAGFLFGLRSDFDSRILRPDFMDLKETNSRGECMIRPWVYMNLDEYICISPESFHIWILIHCIGYIYVTCNIME